jgi:hypothetical protein
MPDWTCGEPGTHRATAYADATWPSSRDVVLYRTDFAEASHHNGRVLHRRGVTNVPGLYFLGLSWQHTRGSALLGWVGQDGEFIARQLAPASSADVLAGNYESAPRALAASASEGV